jgi:hypothetical protein
LEKQRVYPEIPDYSTTCEKQLCLVVLIYLTIWMEGCINQMRGFSGLVALSKLNEAAIHAARR